MSDWEMYKLGDIVNFGNGKTRPSSEGSVPVYGGNGILGYCADKNYDNETIVIGRVGAYCGATYYENQPVWISDNALSAKPKGENIVKYFFYLLKNMNLNQHSIGSSHPLITQTLLNSLDVKISNNPKEQHAIASILSSLDDKIDLLHRQNNTLESMAETLFRQWFVEETQDDWAFIKLGDAIETTSGGTPSRSKMEYYENGTIHWVKSKELSGSFILETEEMITEDALKKSSAKLLPENSILIAMYGATVGEYGIISKKMTCNQAVCALIPNEKYPYSFLFIFTKINKEKLISMAIGSAQQNISQLLIKQLPVLTCYEKISEFNLIVEPFFEKIKRNKKQIQALEKLRDTLLPKLISGEIRVNYD